MKTKKIFFMVSLFLLGIVFKSIGQNVITTNPTPPTSTPGQFGIQNVMYGVGSGTNTQTDQTPSPSIVGTGTNNAFFGFQSGFNNHFGQSNTFLGSQSGLSNTGGTSNVYIGIQSGFNLPNGTLNTFIGSSSGGALNANANNNTFIGASSGMLKQQGSDNTYIGCQAGWDGQGGGGNTFIGYQAGRSAIGDTNVYIGGQAGNLLQGRLDLSGNARTSDDNVCVGRGAGTGGPGSSTSQNVFIGTSSGLNIFRGNNNTFLGYKTGSNTAGDSNSGAGSGNVFLGNESGSVNVNGGQNVYVGDQSGLNSRDGDANVYIGSLSGSNSNGKGNVFIGNNSGNLYGRNTPTPTVPDVSNHLAIDNSNTLTPLIEGDFGAGVGLKETLTFNVDDTVNSTVIINANGTHPANTVGLSGLQFADLINTNTPSASNGNVLSVDGLGNVILVKDEQGNSTSGITNECSVNNFVTKSKANGNLTCSQIYDNWNGGNEDVARFLV